VSGRCRSYRRLSSALIVDIASLTNLSKVDIDRVTTLAAEVSNSDGLNSLLEKMVFRLGESSEANVTHLLASMDNGVLCGYAHVARTGSAEGPSVELFVARGYRRQRVGTLLLHHVREIVRDESFRLWSHGAGDGVTEFAQFSKLKLVKHLARLDLKVPQSLSWASEFDGFTYLTVNDLVSDFDWMEVLDRSYPADLHAKAISERTWHDPEFSSAALESHTRQVVGVLITRPMRHRGRRALEIHMVAVLPEFRGRGISNNLIRSALAKWSSAGGEVSMSYVDIKNTAALRSHLANGFVQTSVDSVFVPIR